MPFGEYLRWSVFYKQREDDSKNLTAPGGGKNLLAGDDNNLVRGLTGGQ
jgi:hypothetical protein